MIILYRKNGTKSRNHHTGWYRFDMAIMSKELQHPHQHPLEGLSHILLICKRGEAGGLKSICNFQLNVFLGDLNHTTKLL